MSADDAAIARLNAARTTNHVCVAFACHALCIERCLCMRQPIERMRLVSLKSMHLMRPQEARLGKLLTTVLYRGTKNVGLGQ